MPEGTTELEASKNPDRIAERIANLKHQSQYFHKRVIEETGGRDGLREEDNLDSAIAAPFATFDGEDLHPTVFDKAGALMRSLSLDHPFIDGNKRVSLGMTAAFLLEHGVGLKESLSDDEIVDFCLELASGRKKVEEVAVWLKTNTDRSSARNFREIMKKFQNI